MKALQEQIANHDLEPGRLDAGRRARRGGAQPVAPTPKRDAMLAFIVALVLGAVAIYLRDLFFDRYGSAQDAARDLDLQLLGEIPKVRKDAPLESFRSLRTAIVFALDRGDVRALNVTRKAAARSSSPAPSPAAARATSPPTSPAPSPPRGAR